MNKQQLQQAQRQAAPQMLVGLVQSASRRFLTAARLVEWHSPIIESLSMLGIRKSIDVRDLTGPFDVLCAHYRELLYTPQRELFKQDDPYLLWENYYYQTLLPHVLQNGTLVRNTLRCAGGLPTENFRMARDAVQQYFAELTLPHTAPPWAPEEMFR